jgi:hypothetical protein
MYYTWKLQDLSHYLWLMKKKLILVTNSVADPDLDPVGSGPFWSDPDPEPDPDPGLNK